MKKKQNIFVVYGRHPEEVFALDVGREIENIGRKDFQIKQYKPTELDAISIKSNLSERQAKYHEYRNEFKKLNRFVKENLPVDYVVDLHDSRNDEWMKAVGDFAKEDIRLPDISVFYDSKTDVNKELQKELTRYCLSKPHISPSFKSRDYKRIKGIDYIIFEYLPLAKKEESVAFNLGVIDLLLSYGIRKR